jgi:hypothetical protein
VTVDWIADATRAGIELRALIREAHEATRDAKAAKKELQEYLASVRPAVEEQLEVTVTKELAKLGDATEEAMRKAVEKVSSEFSTLEDIMLGRNADGPPLDAVAFAYRLLQLIKENPGRVALTDLVTGKVVNPGKL